MLALLLWIRALTWTPQEASFKHRSWGLQVNCKFYDPMVLWSKSTSHRNSFGELIQDICGSYPSSAIILDFKSFLPCVPHFSIVVKSLNQVYPLLDRATIRPIYYNLPPIPSSSCVKTGGVVGCENHQLFLGSCFLF